MSTGIETQAATLPDMPAQDTQVPERTQPDELSGSDQEPGQRGDVATQHGGQRWITDAVSLGTYRRPSLSPEESFRSVTACSPVSSSPSINDVAGSETFDQRLRAPTPPANRDGRRRMVRSGTSGSLTVATPHDARSPSPSNPVSGPATSPQMEQSGTHLLAPDASVQTNDRVKTSSAQVKIQRSGSSSSSTSSGFRVRVPSSNSGVANLIHRVIRGRSSEEESRSSADSNAPHDIVTTRFATVRPRTSSSVQQDADRLQDGLSALHTSNLPSSSYQLGSSPTAESYFPAFPASPSDRSSIPSRSKGKGRARISLRKRFSFSSHSYASSSGMELDDEACFIDSDEDKIPRIDFLSQLPPELALCIICHLEDHHDVLAAARVSKAWRTIAMDHAVWRHLFFLHPGWEIREDAPLVLQRQAERRRLRIKADEASAKARKEELEELEKTKQRRPPHAYMNRLAALKSWRETLHIPSLPDLAALSLSGRSGASNGSSILQTPNKRRGGAVDVDGEGFVASPPSSSAAMSPLRSATASSGRFGLFLSPARGPSTPAGKRRAQEASTSNAGAASPSASSIYDGFTLRSDSRSSIDETLAVEAEEYFAASLDWAQLYKDRLTLEQRWKSIGIPEHQANHADAPHTSTLSRRRSQLARALSSGSQTKGKPSTKPFEPSRKFLPGHTDSVYCVQQDDGVGLGTQGKIVSGSRDRTIRVWDAENGHCQHIMKGHTASVLSLQYDSEILVSGSSDSEVFVWDFSSILRTSAEQGKEAVVHDRTKVLTRLRGHSSAVLDVAFDSEWIVTSSKDATVRVWRRSDYSMYRKFSHGGPVNAVDLQQGQIVSASGDGSMYLWDIESGVAVHAFSGHTKGLACLSFKGDMVVSGSNDKTIRVWNTKDGRCTHVIRGHEHLVRTVAFCPDQRLIVSGGYDKVIKAWDISDDFAVVVDATEDRGRSHSSDDPNRRTEQIQSQEPDSAAGTASDFKLIQTPIRDLKCHRARIFDINFNTTRIVSASEDHMICINHFGGQGIDTSLFA